MKIGAVGAELFPMRTAGQREGTKLAVLGPKTGSVRLVRT